MGIQGASTAYSENDRTLGLFRGVGDEAVDQYWCEEIANLPRRPRREGWHRTRRVPERRRAPSARTSGAQRQPTARTSERQMYSTPCSGNVEKRSCLHRSISLFGANASCAQRRFGSATSLLGLARRYAATRHSLDFQARRVWEESLAASFSLQRPAISAPFSMDSDV